MQQCLKASSRPAGSRVSLAGTWIAMGYECPWGKAHVEKIRISHAGSNVTATKLTGDRCVPAGLVTFAGELDPNAAVVGANFLVTWTLGDESRPACCKGRGELNILGAHILKTASSSKEVIVFVRESALDACL